MKDEYESPYPFIITALAFALFVVFYPPLHSMWTTAKPAAENLDGTEHTAEMLTHIDYFVFPIAPLVFLALAFFYLNIRSHRDSGGGF